ncbi:MAG TPA: GFA family protein [Phenylobacterium sp.]|nr:GFA family protein [Phenylobacterium sp.]
MIEADCLCGAVRIEVASPPETVTACNCSACRRLGALWAYCTEDQVRISGDTVAFARRDLHRAEPMLAFHHCPTCGCVTHWSSLVGGTRMAVNARLMDPQVQAAARVRLFDGAGI